MSEQTVPLPAPAGPPSPPPARHPVSIGHLVMGVALLGLVAVWALHAGDVVDGADIRWLLPAPWVIAGVAGLVALVASDRRRARRPQPVLSVRSDQPAGPDTADAEPSETMEA